MKCEQYFQIDATPEAWKVMMASTHLDEKAQWHQALMCARRGRVVGGKNMQKL